MPDGWVAAVIISFILALGSILSIGLYAEYKKDMMYCPACDKTFYQMQR